MSTLVRSRGLTLCFVTASLLLAAGCTGMKERPPQATATPPKPQATPSRTPVGAGVIVIVTDQTGTLLGAVSLPNPVADPITIHKSDVIAPKSIEEVAPEKIFLSPGFQSITIFAMGDPCQYIVQGGQAIKKCW